MLLLALALAGCSRRPVSTRTAPSASAPSSAGPAPAAASEVPAAPSPAAAAPPPVDSAVYARRPIATPMGFGGASWLDRPDREKTEEPEKVLDALAILPGSTVADVGAGTGFFSLRIARRVGPAGHVVATDLEPRMLALLAERAAEQRLDNIETRVVTSDDPRLDAASVDLVLMVDVYHELVHPAAELAAVRRALRPAGRLALVEYRGEDPRGAIKPEHKMTRAQVEAEVEPAGFREVADHEFLRDQRVLVFAVEGAGEP
jgi:SAM-dependent methyltransferase